MEINKFIIDFKEFLEIDSIDELTSETIIRNLEEFDSFFVLTIDGNHVININWLVALRHLRTIDPCYV